MLNKLFISLPMGGRTKEDVMKSMKELHEVAEIMYGRKLEVIPTYIEEEPPDGLNENIWYLGKSIEKLAEADYFIGCKANNTIKGQYKFKGCEVEAHIAIEYGIQYRFINVFDYSCFKDMKDTIDKYLVR